MNVFAHGARRWVPVLWVALGALMAAGSNPLSAQTLEGTVITNTATATYTDANTNTYAAVSGSVSVTVGFQGMLDVSSPANATPASPSSGNVVTWTITNNGNGNDQIQVGVTSSDTNVAGNISFVYGGTPYATVALLNTRLALVTDSIARGANITIDVVYDVQSGEGGNSSNVELTATSTRAGGDANQSTTVVTADLTGTVSVARDVAAIDRLPSNGTVLYTTTFQVTSGLTGTADIDLVATLDGTNPANVVVTQIGETGSLVAGNSTTLSFTSGEVIEITVEYRVDGTPADAGSISTLTLTGTATAVSGSPSGFDEHQITIIAPSLSVSKTVHGSQTDAENNSTSTLAGDPRPGDTIWYRVEVTNNGTATAVMTGGSNGISDDFSTLPVTYVGGSLSQTGSPVAWSTLGEASEVITGTIAGGLSGGSTAWFVFAVTID